MKETMLVAFLLLSCEAYQNPIKAAEVKSEQKMSSSKEQINPNIVKMQKIDRLFSKYAFFFPRAKNILVSELDALNSKEIVYVDVRESRETEVSMIEGALTQKEFEKNRENYKNHIIVVYCTIGYRSGRYSQKLIDKNFKAFNLKGGVLAWSHDKREFFRGKQKTKSVHVYGKTWNLLHSDYNPIF